MNKLVASEITFIEIDGIKVYVASSEKTEEKEFLLRTGTK